MSRKKKYSEDLNETMLSMYNKEMSLNEISRKLNVPIEVVRRRLKQMEVPIRNRSQAMVLFHKNKGIGNTNNVQN